MNEFVFRPTHVAPQDGMPTWTAPDPSHPSARLDPLLPVQLLDRQGDWSRIVCSNGWSAWVDGRLLITLPAEPGSAAGPLSRAADPRPMLAEAERALGLHRGLLDDLAEGRIDLETFGRRAQGLRIGVLVDGESLWLYDHVHDRWCYCDGLQLQTYAAGRPADPSAPATPPPDQAAPGTPPPGGPARPSSPPPASPPAPGGAARPAGYEPTRTGDR
ncbi:hypothetical protein [Streptomyces sp. CB03911]|uniref:hypothetical protein n=1 Tax=Streptomyces sp. CB03911 TaxID=1804758 RepID=UPI00093D39B1|nr:hypothetical protein [Streptomyces sp. CB03911]OKI13145.1 hypothetical protein A6A07_14560 [Streptomyces sp. CB03911]